MKLSYILIMSLTLGLAACSSSKDDPSTPNTYSFSHIDNDGLIKGSVVQFSTSTKSQDVEVIDVTKGTSEIKRVNTTVYKPVIYQTQFLNKCDQTSSIGKVKSEYIVDSTSESCSEIIQATSIGLIDLRAAVLKSLPEAEKMTSDTDSDIFLALPLHQVSSARIVEINAPSLPMVIIFDLQSMKVRGFIEKQNTVASSVITANINSAHKLNTSNSLKHKQLVTALQKAGLYGKTNLTPEELEKIRQIAAESI